MAKPTSSLDNSPLPDPPIEPAALDDDFEQFLRQALEDNETSLQDTPTSKRPRTCSLQAAADLSTYMSLDAEGAVVDDILPAMFQGDDGGELLGREFDNLQAPAAVAPQQQQQQDGLMADAARSLLNTFGSLSKSPIQQQQQQLNSPSQQQQQQLLFLEQQQQMLNAMMQMNNPQQFAAMQAPTLMIDPMTGQIIQHPMYNNAVQLHQINGQLIAIPIGQQQFMLSQMPLALPGNMQYMNMMGGMMMSPAQSPSGRKTPKRRRQAKPVSETQIQDRATRIDAGYTVDPKTGKIYHYGPAMIANAKDNKELPVVKGMFESFNEHQFHAGSPPPGWNTTGNNATTPSAAATVAAANTTNGVSSPSPVLIPGNIMPQAAAISPLINPNWMTAAMDLKQQQQSSPAAKSNTTATASLSKKEPTNTSNAVQSLAPGGRHLSPEVGHGVITSLVTHALKTSPMPTNAGVGPSTAAVQETDDNESNNAILKGVSRDKWSLFWDAHLPVSISPNGSGDSIQTNTQHPGSSSSLIQGFRQEAIFLGKFPTKEMAGKAHDLAALKHFGQGAQTNFPRENYAATLPLLQSHTEEEIIHAIRKDSDLALQRTSKFKGVRKVGQGLYEAKVATDWDGATTTTSQHRGSAAVHSPT